MIVSPARFLLLASILSLSAAGCSFESLPQRKRASPDASGVAKMVCKDGTGRRVEVPQDPRRIVSLAPSVTEVVYLLGAADRLIGVTTHCDWPPEARGKPKIGDLLNPNYELILSMKADLVIASTAGNDQTSVMKLADLGLPVYVTAPRSVEGIFETVAAVGRITGCAARGEQLVSEMKTRLGEVERRLAGLPPTRAFFVTWFDPLLAPGKNTFETDVLRLAGVESITAGINEFYPRCSLEQILAQEPDVILTSENKASPLPDLSRLAGWRHLRAVRKGRVYILSEALQRPSPRFLDGVEEVARKIHPERFP